MITVEQSRKFFPPEECPSDRDLERMLASMYSIATREWDLIVAEQAKAKEKPPP